MNEQKLFTPFYNKMLELFPDMFLETEKVECIGVVLCLMPLIHPELMENIIRQEFGMEGDFPLVGGIRGNQFRGILPTGETWMFFYCANETEERIRFVQNVPQYLSHPEALLNIEPALPGEPFLSGRLQFSNYFRRKFQQESLLFEQRISNLSLGGFIESKLSLEDLILPNSVLNSIEEVRQWQHFQDQDNVGSVFLKRVKPGLKMIYHGKSGTGKTQTAAIIGRELGKKVYRIDLSQIVSKYIGETEKNLSKIFEVAEHKQWILFFDEGDALFGKRTSVNSSNDRYANQEVAYLLQRIEDYTGIIIVSTNFKENIDSAFLRRFQIITEFSLPDKGQRMQIWSKLFSELADCEINLSEQDWNELVKTELSGGAITNIVNYALLKSSYVKKSIALPLIKEGIIRELRKENRLTSL